MTPHLNVGDRVRVHLYNRAGILFNTVTGTVSDFSFKVEVAPGMLKDLVWVTRIEGYERLNPETGETEVADEGWFPLPDVERLPDEDETPTPRFFTN
ncbi:MAG: hypothetical protein AAGI71_07345 [Bacteroidota bacterium]